MNKIPKLFLFLSLPLYVIDQITKWWIVFKFPEPYVDELGRHYEPTEVVWEGVFNLVRRHNQGVAFGFGNGTEWAPILFLFVLVAALVMIVIFWRRGAFMNAPARVAAALLVAGILGNMTDRLFQGFWLKEHEEKSFLTRLSKGYVVDFLDFKIPGYDKISPRSGGHWPAFNVADSCISCAAVLLVVSAFRPEEEDGEKP
ncbi:MAG: signal peptidase II [Verrucomicrobiales bacterium]